VFDWEEQTAKLVSCWWLVVDWEEQTTNNNQQTTI
jgi:hypothetical protein